MFINQVKPGGAFRSVWHRNKTSPGLTCWNYTNRSSASSPTSSLIGPWTPQRSPLISLHTFNLCRGVCVCVCENSSSSWTVGKGALDQKEKFKFSSGSGGEARCVGGARREGGARPEPITTAFATRTSVCLFNFRTEGYSHFLWCHVQQTASKFVFFS